MAPRGLLTGRLGMRGAGGRGGREGEAWLALGWPQSTQGFRPKRLGENKFFFLFFKPFSNRNQIEFKHGTKF
jgi:hypothetical protein